MSEKFISSSHNALVFIFIRCYFSCVHAWIQICSFVRSKYERRTTLYGSVSVINGGRRSIRLNSIRSMLGWSWLKVSRHNGIVFEHATAAIKDTVKSTDHFHLPNKIHKIAVIVYILKIYCFIWNEMKLNHFSIFFVACVGAFSPCSTGRTTQIQKVQLISWWAHALARSLFTVNINAIGISRCLRFVRRCFESGTRR